MLLARHLLLAGLALAQLTLTACEPKDEKAKKSSNDDDDDDDDEPKKKSSASASASTAPPASASQSPEPSASASASSATDFGPVVKIPSGKLLLGHACGAVPRVTDEELSGTFVDMGEFSIDQHPYPNDPQKPIKTGVTRQEAEDLCKAAGKRLCSEVEWERACKGASNSTFEYSGSYDKKACEDLTSGLPGQRSKCVSGFGVKDMHGLAFEWTSSTWGRGQSGLATVRGYKGSSNVVRERCASGQGREPMRASADTGFRCCGGPQNPYAVDLPISRQPVLTEDARVDGDLITDLLRAMPQDHQKVPKATVSFDKVWRWHPRDNEELIIARWIARPEDRKPPFYEVGVFKMCGGAATRVQRIRGPVERVESVRETTAKEKITISVSTKKDRGNVDLSYWYGSVALTEPSWIKAGNTLDLGEKERTPRIPPGKIRLPRKK